MQGPLLLFAFHLRGREPMSRSRLREPCPLQCPLAAQARLLMLEVTRGECGFGSAAKAHAPRLCAQLAEP